jgi:CSLREA domain-containing protein
MSGASPRARGLLPKALLALAALALAAMLLAVWSGPAEAATTFTVNKTSDGNDLDFPGGTFDDSSDGKCDTSGKSGNQCTLRAAIQEANETPGADTINFGIPGRRPKVKTINVGSTGNGALPIITDAVTINGYTQRGSRANTLAEGNDARLRVQLNGTNAGDANGLLITASNSTIKGLVINRFEAHGVLIFKSLSGSVFNKVEGNFIGTSANGSGDLGNGVAGVSVGGVSDTTIGGTDPAKRNVISGNGDDGVEINKSGSSGATANNVEGNFIGTTASGSGDLGNTGEGVFIGNGSANTIGGTATGARNVISGNGDYGVRIVGTGATGNEVLGNFIGTTADGTGDLGNRNGVNISIASNNTIGGTTSASRNVISGNSFNGVEIQDSRATGNEVLGNFIGTTADGSAALGNGDNGVSVGGAPNNTIGGTASGAGNRIAHNGGDGVVIFSVTGNSVLSNSIFSNGELGIDLFPDGVTANDPVANKDSDTGANNLQNFPVITSVTQSSSLFNPTTISGTLNSTPSQNFTVQCFLAGEIPEDADASGHGEGKFFMAEDTTVTTDPTTGNGSFECNFLFPQSLEGKKWSATATNEATGDTSEFSANFPAG